jgi:hypothetical protein
MSVPHDPYQQLPGGNPTVAGGYPSAPGSSPGPPPSPSPPSKPRSPVPLIVGLVVGVVAVLVLALAVGGDGGNGGGAPEGQAAETQGDAGESLPEEVTVPTFPTIPGGGTTPETTAAPDPEDSPLADLEPCSILTLDEAATLGARAERDPYGEDEVGRARTCGWRVRGATGPETAGGSTDATVVVAIYDTLAIEDMAPPESWEVTSLEPMNGRDVQQKLTETGTTCLIAVEVSDTSHVEVTATSGNGDMCALALEGARLVEPDLP